jgi:glutamine synthetase
VGFETEFILLRSTNPIEPVGYHDYAASSSIYTGSVSSKALTEIASCLKLGGVELQLYHAEAAPGQFEIVTEPLSPLEAADALVFTRETIKNVAHKHNLHATLAPRVFGNSCMSIFQSFRNSFEPE